MRPPSSCLLQLQLSFLLVAGFVNIDYLTWLNDPHRERCQSTIDCCDDMHPETPTDQVGSYGCEVSPLQSEKKLEYWCYDYSGTGIVRLGPYDLECKEDELAWCYDGPDDIPPDENRWLSQNSKHGMCTDEEEFYGTWIQKNDEIRCISMLRDWMLDRDLSDIADRIWSMTDGQITNPHDRVPSRYLVGYMTKLGPLETTADYASWPQKLTLSQYKFTTTNVGLGEPFMTRTSDRSRDHIFQELHPNADKVQLCAHGIEPSGDDHGHDYQLTLKLVLALSMTIIS